MHDVEMRNFLTDIKTRLRLALAGRLGAELTPEAAAAIEVEAMHGYIEAWADIASGDAAPDHAQVEALEAGMSSMPHIDLPTHMGVWGAVGARTIFIPAGTTLTGVETRRDNVCVISGDITVTTQSGPKRLTGFHVIPARAGFRRAGYAHADTWWTTLHHTDLTDPALIEAEMAVQPERLAARVPSLAFSPAAALNRLE